MRSVHPGIDVWFDTVTRSGRGQIKVNPIKELGILDHTWWDPQASWIVPARVVLNKTGSTVMMTIYQPAVMTDQRFEEAMREMDKQFNTLKEILEASLANGGSWKAALFSSLCEFLADRQQFPAAFCARLGVTHPELLERVEHDCRYDQSGVLLVVGRNDIPRRIRAARRTQALLVRFRVRLPVTAFLDVRETEFPILFRLIDARQKALALLLL